MDIATALRAQEIDRAIEAIKTETGFPGLSRTHPLVLDAFTMAVTNMEKAGQIQPNDETMAEVYRLATAILGRALRLRQRVGHNLNGMGKQPQRDLTPHFSRLTASADETVLRREMQRAAHDGLQRGLTAMATRVRSGPHSVG